MKKQPKFLQKSSSALRVVSEAASELESQWPAITSIAAKIGCMLERLRR